MIFKKNKQLDFSVDIYKKFSLDLQHLSDKELAMHFKNNMHERRIYAAVFSDVEFLSMKWLRGNGMEIGAGKYPTPLFGNASLIHADCDEGLAFGGKKLHLLRALDSNNFPDDQEEKYDFVIASHVLEHCDSFIRAIKNLNSIIKKSGLIYIVLPDINFLHDKNFIDNFDFQHHLEEYFEPYKHNNIHDDAHIKNSDVFIDTENYHAILSDDYKGYIRKGEIPQGMRFMYHKHNYDFEGWIDLIMNTKKYLGDKFNLVDLRYGHLRNDCHFIIQKN
jgi:SAM-dependent methyltransferase